MRVTRTLNVPTPRGLTAVLANKDSLEMEHLAKVGKTISKKSLSYSTTHDKSLKLYTFPLSFVPYSSSFHPPAFLFVFGTGIITYLDCVLLTVVSFLQQNKISMSVLQMPTHATKMQFV